MLLPNNGVRAWTWNCPDAGAIVNFLSTILCKNCQSPFDIPLIAQATHRELFNLTFERTTDCKDTESPEWRGESIPL